MNETSRGGERGDPPIGGFPPAASSTTPSSGSTEGGGVASSRVTTSTSSNNDQTQTHLPSLGASLGSDLEGLGEGLSLTRLLAGDSASWDFTNDPLGASNQSQAAREAQAREAANQGSYRPWEAAALSSSSTTTPTSSSFTTLTSLNNAPPNVLAPPSGMSMPRPHAHHTAATMGYYPSAHHAHFMDHAQTAARGLPSFQSQFQEVPPTYGAAAAQATPHHYPLVPPPVQAREIPNIQQQFLDERQHVNAHAHAHAMFYGHAHHALAQPRPQFPPTSRLAAHITSPLGARKSSSAHHPHHHQLATPTSAQQKGVASSSAPSASEMTTLTNLTSVEAAHPTLAAQLRKKTTRAGSLEGSESDRSSINADTPGQVAAISSTDPTPESLAGLADAFKSPHSHSHSGIQHPTPSMGVDDPDKPQKKKRKR